MYVIGKFTGKVINYVKLNLQRGNGDQKFLTIFIVSKWKREREREWKREREKERERERERVSYSPMDNDDQNVLQC